MSKPEFKIDPRTKVQQWYLTLCCDKKLVVDIEMTNGDTLKRVVLQSFDIYTVVARSGWPEISPGAVMTTQMGERIMGKRPSDHDMSAMTAAELAQVSPRVHLLQKHAIRAIVMDANDIPPRKPKERVAH